MELLAQPPDPTLITPRGSIRRHCLYATRREVLHFREQLANEIPLFRSLCPEDKLFLEEIGEKRLTDPAIDKFPKLTFHGRVWTHSGLDIRSQVLDTKGEESALKSVFSSGHSGGVPVEENRRRNRCIVIFFGQKQTRSDPEEELCERLHGSIRDERESDDLGQRVFVTAKHHYEWETKTICARSIVNEQCITSHSAPLKYAMEKKQRSNSASRVPKSDSKSVQSPRRSRRR
jgi:hypothetical protein